MVDERILDHVWELYTHLDNVEPSTRLLDAVEFFCEMGFDPAELPLKIFDALKQRVNEER